MEALMRMIIVVVRKLPLEGLLGNKKEEPVI